MIDRQSFAPWVSEEAAALFARESRRAPAPHGNVAALRRHYDAYNRRLLDEALAHYPVSIAPDTIGGVRVDVVTPASGVASERTLLCLHGGAFMWGRGAGALLEAVPVAAVAKVRVIAVEYALAPEASFPAAVEDVIAVYDALRDAVAPAAIGIYGCSAGGVLTAQTVARLIADDRPLPGAIAMFCGTGLDMLGDSWACTAHFTPAEAMPDFASLLTLPYFTTADATDAMVMPGGHPDVLARFPPSLLVTGTRDFAASSVATMHRRLLAAGVDASAITFDGMWHAFHMATTLPEAREAFTALARFFDRHLA